MGLNKVYRKYLQELQTIYSPGEASHVTSLIFEFFGGISRSDVIKDPFRTLEDRLVIKLDKSLQELLHFKPVQYVTGEAWFCKMKLKVSEAVLIPRPETEELVYTATGLINNNNFTILDIGTGSGCIAIAIKKNNKNSHVTAIDISKDALQVAAKNAKSQETDIAFIELDFMEESNWKNLKKFDIIISNPPYIPENESKSLSKNVIDYEPHTALFVASNEPIIFYKKIGQFARSHLSPGGHIILETHEEYAKQVADHFIGEGYKTNIKKDMFEKERILIACKFVPSVGKG